MAGVNRLYPDSVAPLPQSPAGYRPVYLSHYGRHGSRYLTDGSQYTSVYEVLVSAHDAGVLTPLGEDVLGRYVAVYPLIHGREGELTMVGAQQHTEIARRMVERYPELFRGRARVEANSTNLQRTMLSMQYFTQELRSLRPSLDLHADASRVYMGCINQHSPENPKVTPEDVRWKSPDAPWRPAFWEYFRSVIDWEPFCRRLFSDYDWLCGRIDPFEFGRNFYAVALNIPSCPVECSGFFDLFTSEELALLGQMDNYAFYVEKGRYPGGNLRGCFLSEAVLTDLIGRVEPDLAGGVKVRLRFGHDGCIMALFAMLRFPGWDAQIADPTRAWEVWDVSRIPMAANFQLVFYALRGWRGGGTDAAGGSVEDDLIFTFLLNEEPLALPLPDLGGHFYRWTDFLTWCAPILTEARAALGD